MATQQNPRIPSGSNAFPARTSDLRDTAETREIQSVTRIVLRPIASALPLGFYAFGIGLLLLSALELRWIDEVDARNVPMVLLGFVAPLELLGAVIAFLARDTAAATALGIFSFSWVAQGLVFLHQGQHPSATLGILFLMLAFILLALAVVGYSAKPLLSVVLFAAFLRSITALLVEFGISQLGTTSAILGLALAVLSLYGGTAFLIEDVKQKDSLPVFRRGPAKEAVQGDLNQQLRKMPNEPGVRHQL